ncbi:LapA family protein [Actinoplanes sp. TBRC 11911]|uniref:LapA family protein n=1 Tax=Actinoplanes sp. TBRC 11911 TaxID=2729386 RepID=UPI00145DD1E4|nr:LapA family protein [Actinoplanes sp. TBRC 11911]NMO55645.1 LapA family protein [Actinoplanes sp. TBRC 11911]
MAPPEERPESDLPPPAGPSTTLPPVPTHPTATGTRRPYTRIRAAWVGVWAGLLAIILLIIFVAQNTAKVDIHFLWMDGRIPVALALLIAGVGGAIIALAVSAARMIQMRRHLRRDS